MFYVYEMINPATDEVFYVGKGSGYRYLVHERESKSSPALWTNPGKCHTILQILATNQDIKYNICNFADEKEAYRYERQLIYKYGRLCNNTGTLTNLLPGGKGGSPHVVYVFNRSDGSFVGEFASQAEASVALGVSPSSISETLSNNRTGSRLYLFSRTRVVPNKHIKPNINVYELPTKTLLGSFNTELQAATAIGVAQTLISGTLLHKQPLIARRYVVVLDNQPLPTCRILERENIDTGELKTYANLTDAMIDVGIDRSSILRSIRSNGKYSGCGNLWRYIFV